MAKPNQEKIRVHVKQLDEISMSFSFTGFSNCEQIGSIHLWFTRVSTQGGTPNRSSQWNVTEAGIAKGRYSSSSNKKEQRNKINPLLFT